MTVDDEAVRLVVYRNFAQTGAAPDLEALVREFGITHSDVRDHLRRLAAGRDLVLDDQHRIVMAHPFAAVPLGFSVMGRSTLWWGGCAYSVTPAASRCGSPAPDTNRAT
jgi:hypothetical protein